MQNAFSLPLPDLDSLSLSEQVAQLIVVRASGYLFDHQIRYPVWEPPTAILQSWLQNLGFGGVILLGGSAGELALRTEQLQSWAKLPLLLAADIEEGVGQRFPGATTFPPPMALHQVAQTDLALAQRLATQMGAITAQEAAAVGLNWVLAPIVDVNNNPDNPVINVRAFGEQPEIVQALTTAFIEGVKSVAVLTTAKHFPGHGDTAADSHLELPVLPHTLERLQALELLPFQAAIAAGVDSVMTAHLLIPELDPDLPATLSPRILSQLLRHDLGFGGLIVTDALVMGAIANRYGANEAAVLAIAAGADIVLMPADPPGALQAICAAVESGRLSPDQIRASLERVWQAKTKVLGGQLQADSQPHAWEAISPPLRIHEVAQPQSLQVVDEILQASQQFSVPQPLLLASGQRYRNLIVLDQALDSKDLGGYAPAISRPKQLGYDLQVVDGLTPPTVWESDPSQVPMTLLQVFIRGNPFRGSAGLNQKAWDWFQFLLTCDRLQGLVIYGSPYVLDKFLPALPISIPYVFTYGQTVTAQTQVFNLLFPDSVPPNSRWLETAAF